MDTDRKMLCPLRVPCLPRLGGLFRVRRVPDCPLSLWTIFLGLMLFWLAASSGSVSTETEVHGAPGSVY